MSDFGEKFRLLRKERGLTLKNMSKDIISFSYLSKFEKGESDITLNNIVKLISRLNMTLDEFLYFNQIGTTNYKEGLRKISLAYAENNKAKLKKYYVEELNLYKKTNIIFHKCNAIMIGSIIKDIDQSFLISQEDINIMCDYIIKCSYWTQYEVSLVGNSLTFFSKSMTAILIKEIKNRLEEFKVAERNERDLIALLQNACILFLRQGEIEEVEHLSSFINSRLVSSYYFEKTRQLFIDGIIHICEGDEDIGITKAEQAIEIMAVLHPSFATDHQKELNEFLNL